MPDDVYKICRKIAGEIWEGVPTDYKVNRKDVYIKDMTISLKQTSVPKMVKAIQDMSKLPVVSDKVELLILCQSVRDYGEQLLNALKGDKPVEESHD